MRLGITASGAGLKRDEALDGRYGLGQATGFYSKRIHEPVAVHSHAAY